MDHIIYNIEFIQLRESDQVVQTFNIVLQLLHMNRVRIHVSVVDDGSCGVGTSGESM